MAPRRRGHFLLKRGRRALREVTAVRLANGSFAQPVGQFLRGLPSAFDSLDGATATSATHNAVDLIQTIVGCELQEARRDDPTAELMLRIDDYINAHLDVHGLTPSMVAAAHYISIRHLHELFQKRGTSVSKDIRERQLERARRDLRGPRRGSENITAIARSWGFSDPAQFSRSFRAFAGMPPSRYRALQ